MVNPAPKYPHVDSRPTKNDFLIFNFLGQFEHKQSKIQPDNGN
jgi:hypothetical protein